MAKYINLTKGYKTIVDDNDYDVLIKHSWYAIGKKNVYAGRKDKITRQNIMMHREILDVNEFEKVDHKDGDGLNNTRGNLRKCNQSLNRANSKVRKDNAIGYKGVTLRKDRRNKKWHAYIYNKNRRISLGSYETPEEAARAYDKTAKKIYGEFARLNF